MGELNCPGGVAVKKHCVSGFIEVREGAHTGSIEQLMPPKHALAMRHEARVCEDQWEGEKMPYRQSQANSLLFIPQRSSFSSRLADRQYSGTLILIDQALLASAALPHFDYSRIGFRCMDASSPITLNTVQTIRQFTVADDLKHWPLLVESASISLAVSLIRSLSPDAAAVIDRSRSGFSGERRRRVMEYIDDNINRQMTIAELAGVACMSQFHFSRSFKKAIGLTPLQYLAQRRVEAAQKLLRGTSKALAEVAHDCGYASQSHMTTVFKNVLGVTPGWYRRGVLGALAVWLVDLLLPATELLAAAALPVSS